MNFRKQVKPGNIKKKQQKEDFLENLYNLFEDRGRALNSYGNLKILTPKQMLQKLPIDFAQVKADKTFTEWNRTNHICLLLSKRNH